jgi:hypothetical protein
LKTHVLTVCNLRTLPHALVLRASLREYHPEWPLLHIGLVDFPKHVPANLLPTEGLIDVQRIGLPDFAGLMKQYTTLEFTNLTKPVFARYLLDTQPDLGALVYLAPETQLFAPLTALHERLQSHDLVLTSWLKTVLPGSAGRAEKEFLNAGTYQNGCWALRRSASADAFLGWWSDRLLRKGQWDLCRGFGSDRLWLDLAPAYFDRVHLLDTPGYAVGTWNRHEHTLRWENSAYQWGDAPLTTVQWTPHRTLVRPLAEQARLWRALAADYQTHLDAYGYASLAPLTPAWGRPDPTPVVAPWRRALAQPLRQVVRLLDSYQPDWLYH